MGNILDIIRTVKDVTKNPSAIENLTEAAKNAKALNIKQIIDDALDKIGHANILIAGKTGVGKSTLINAVFKGDLAETGVGYSVTQHMKEYSKEGEPVHIFDTKGFELGNYREVVKELRNEIVRRKQAGNPTEQIHLAWLCISNEGKRLEHAESEFISEWAQEILVVVVLT